jgi:O-methyltransferase
VADYGPWPIETVLHPWTDDPAFWKIYERIVRHTLVSLPRCHMLYALARHASSLPGQFAECGVYKGGTALLFASILHEGKKRLDLFDTFKGIPPGDPEKDNRYVTGGEFWETSQKSVMDLLTWTGANYFMHPGEIPGTLKEVSDDKFAFVHIDVDIYWPALTALTFFHDRLTPGGIIVLDDYGFEQCQGVKKAADEFAKDTRASLIYLPTGQAMFIGKDLR